MIKFEFPANPFAAPVAPDYSVIIRADTAEEFERAKFLLRRAIDDWFEKQSTGGPPIPEKNPPPLPAGD